MTGTCKYVTTIQYTKKSTCNSCLCVCVCVCWVQKMFNCFRELFSFSFVSIQKTEKKSCCFFAEESSVSLHDYRCLWVFIYLVLSLTLWSMLIKTMESFCRCFSFSVFLGQNGQKDQNVQNRVPWRKRSLLFSQQTGVLFFRCVFVSLHAAISPSYVVSVIFSGFPAPHIWQQIF